MSTYGFSFKLAIFDLDETLWDGKCLYKDTKSILSTLKSCGIPMYLATFNNDALKTCERLDILHYFNDIKHGRDKTKYQMIKEILAIHTHLKEHEIAFFDDNPINIEDVKKKSNVRTVFVQNGIEWAHITVCYVYDSAYDLFDSYK